MSENNADNSAEYTFECGCCNEIYNCPSEPIFSNVNLAEVRHSHLLQYLSFLETERTIQTFMGNDFCYVQADKYLIAAVFKYILRLNVEPTTYTKEFFFCALHLALDICEEANEQYKYSVYVWACPYGTSSDPQLRTQFHYEKMQMFLALGGRGMVCKEWCDNLFQQVPGHPLFQRNRKAGHSGAYMRRVEIVRGKAYYVRNLGSCSLCVGQDDPNLDEENIF